MSVALGILLIVGFGLVALASFAGACLEKWDDEADERGEDGETIPGATL